MQTLNKRKKTVHVVCVILFITMIVIFLGLKREESLEEKEIEEATFVKGLDQGGIYIE